MQSSSNIVAAPDHRFGSSKTYTHSVGLSCAFRQWRAPSHCRFLHGYALKVQIEFGCIELNEQNWCMDFGGLKEIKAWLEEQFDHKTLVAFDDPNISDFREMAVAKIIQLQVVDGIGVEAFAKRIFDQVNGFMFNYGDRVYVTRVTVSEHEGNSAWYERVEQ